MSIPTMVPFDFDPRPEEWRYDHQGHMTETSFNQDEVLRSLYRYISTNGSRNDLFLQKHIKYCSNGLEVLPAGFSSLDASRSWICFWILQSLAMLGHEIPEEIKTRAKETLSRFQNKTGGFGGGPGQVSHLATTYSSIHTLALIGDEEAYSLIDREALYKWFLTLKQPDGSFRMSIGGEIDIRASYCVLSCAALLNLFTEELTSGTSDFISRCQGFDGGLGCYPGVESHGGYSYCGLAALALLGEVEKINISSMISWAAHRQTSPEGGFQGRTNKLVDGCYTFWAGALFPILANSTKKTKSELPDLFSREHLSTYVLNACQMNSGGLRDKPGKRPDYYHSAYVLSGLSITQNVYHFDRTAASSTTLTTPGTHGYFWSASRHPLFEADAEFGQDFMVVPTHPLFNIPLEKVTTMYRHFYKSLP